MAAGHNPRRGTGRRVSEGVLIALITAGGTIGASVVTGGFGVAGNSASEKPPVRTIVTTTVTVPVPSLPAESAGGQVPTSTPLDSGTQKTYLADLEPISTFDDDRWGTEPVTVKGTTYNKSLIAARATWCHSTQRDYVLGGRYSRLRARVGMADDSPETTPLDFYVLADENRVKTISAVGVATPESIDISIKGVSRLTIAIDATTPIATDCAGPNRIGAWLDPYLTP